MPGVTHCLGIGCEGERVVSFCRFAVGRNPLLGGWDSTVSLQMPHWREKDFWGEKREEICCKADAAFDSQENVQQEASHQEGAKAWRFK